MNLLFYHCSAMYLVTWICLLTSIVFRSIRPLAQFVSSSTIVHMHHSSPLVPLSTRTIRFLSFHFPHAPFVSCRTIVHMHYSSPLVTVSTSTISLLSYHFPHTYHSSPLVPFSTHTPFVSSRTIFHAQYLPLSPTSLHECYLYI
jgi:hypothetical protein